MFVVTESNLSSLLRNLSTSQRDRLLNSLIDVLKVYSQEAEDASNPDNNLHQPLRCAITTKENNTTLFMPSSDTTNNAIKIVTLPAKGGTVGVINLFNAEGELIGLVAATEVTAFRTALATMTLFVKCDHITPKNVVLFGSGRQVEWHIRLMLLWGAKDVETITVFNRGMKRLEELDRQVVTSLRESYPGVKFTLIAKEDNPAYDSQLKQVLGNSDVICGCTPSTEPLFPYSYLEQGSPKKNRFISLIGSYKPHMKEIDTTTLLSGGGIIYVDSKTACMEESGELKDAEVGPEQLVEIGQMYQSNSQKGKLDGNVVFKCVGMGIMDLAIARELMKLSRENGLGTDIEW